MKRCLDIPTVLVSLAVVLSCRPGICAPASDGQAIQGIWTVAMPDNPENPEGNGSLIGDPTTRRLAFSGDRMVIVTHREFVDLRRGGAFRLDPARQPKWIDFDVAMHGKKATAHGIYELDGDQLRLSLAEPGVARPSRFDVGEHSGVRLFVARRSLEVIRPPQDDPRPDDPTAVALLKRRGDYIGNDDDDGPIKTVLLKGPEPFTDDDMRALEGVPNLQSFSMNGLTMVTDAGLSRLGQLKRLRVLRINSAGISDDGLAALEGLPELRILEIASPGITDGALPHLQRMAKLRALSLPGTQVTDGSVSALATMQELRELGFRDTKVTDARLESLKRLPRLTALGLHGTRVSDRGLEHLKGLHQLQALDLGRTDVSDAGLKELKGLLQLRWLGLYRANVSDAGLEHLRGLSQLAFVALSGTRVTDEGVKRLHEALPKCHIKR